MKYNILVENFNKSMIDQASFEGHDNLQPKIWIVEDTLRSDVRNQLLDIVRDFWDGLEVDIEMKDITFTGSLANFNWHPHSDIDVHIVANFEDVDADSELVRDYFNARKSLWNQKHKIEIFGYEVDIYVQDDNEEHHSTGVYSLTQNKWLVKPDRETASIDWQNVEDKANSLMDQIDRLSAMFEDQEYEKAYNYGSRLKEKIRKFRQAGLEKIGEYSPENIAFKVLRRNGYMGKLVSLRIAAYDAMNSMESPDVTVSVDETVKGWKSFMKEATRADKEGVELPTVADELTKYASQYSGHPEYFFTFTKLNKVSVMPQSEHFTPAGIYTYPIHGKLVGMLRSGKVPFASDRPYITILKKASDANIITMSKLSWDEYSDALSKLYTPEAIEALGLQDTLFAEDVRAVQKTEKRLRDEWEANPKAAYGRDPRFSSITMTTGENSELFFPNGESGRLTFQERISKAIPFTRYGQRLWKLTNWIAQDRPGGTAHGKRASTVNIWKWNGILRYLGIDGVYDDGGGVIHKNEPDQAVFLKRSAVEIVKTMPNTLTPNLVYARDRRAYKAGKGPKPGPTFEKEGYIDTEPYSGPPRSPALPGQRLQLTQPDLFKIVK